MEIYVVKQKDNVDQIARDFHIPVERLIRDNQLEFTYITMSNTGSTYWFR